MPETRQKYVVYSQLSLLIGMIFCIIIKPKGLAANAGISYYGTFLKTVVPYTAGILSSAFFCYRLAKNLRGSSFAIARNILIIISVLSIGIVLTPYSINAILDWAHTILGSIIFVLELALSGWIIKNVDFNPGMLVLWLLEIGCGIMSAIYIRPPHGFLIQSQLLFQLMFGIILFRSFNRDKQVAKEQYA